MIKENIPPRASFGVKYCLEYAFFKKIGKSFFRWSALQRKAFTPFAVYGGKSSLAQP
jgi:hypothetical protein